MYVLGLSAFYHDSAAAILRNGRIVAAAQEERFTRRKHDAGFPANAIRYCLREAGIAGRDVQWVSFYDKPFLKFERLLETYLAFAPKGFASFRRAMPVWIGEKLFQRDMIRRELTKVDTDLAPAAKLLFTEHHVSHAASAFYPSPFERAAVLTMDGVGEWATTSLSFGHGGQLSVLKEIHFPHSLGLLYSALTYYLGFKVNSGEYKVMGLAPYGEPKYAAKILEHLIDLKEDGSFRLDQSYFDYCTGLTMTNDKFDALFGMTRRAPEMLLTQFHMDLAASLQAVVEEAVLRLARFAVRETGERRLCLAGGVALNCVANGKILREGLVDSIWVQPAAGDAGGALGAALAAWHQHLGEPRVPAPTGDGMQGSYLGPSFTDDEIADRLTAVGACFTRIEQKDMLTRTAIALSEGKAVGWFQGRMEFGPRALGARSILGDPRSATMQRTLNLKVKYRESFRPFAPSVTRESLEDWFDLSTDSPYMLLVAPVHKNRLIPMTLEQHALFGIDKLNVPRSEIPAVTHVDYSARIQTVHRETNPLYHALLEAFFEQTGCPVLVNTSFNVRGEPIVGSPEDAFNCFMGTDIDILVVGNCWLDKNDQDPTMKRDYKDAFELD